MNRVRTNIELDDPHVTYVAQRPQAPLAADVVLDEALVLRDDHVLAE